MLGHGQQIGHDQIGPRKDHCVEALQHVIDTTGGAHPVGGVHIAVAQGLEAAHGPIQIKLSRQGGKIERSHAGMLPGNKHLAPGIGRRPQPSLLQRMRLRPDSRQGAGHRRQGLTIGVGETR